METSPVLQVREYRAGDLAQIMEIAKTAFPREMEVYGFDKESLKKEARLYRLIQLTHRLTGRFFFEIHVGEIEGEVVGTTSLSREGEAWYISMVMVAPQHQRHGYGRALTQAACEAARARGIDRVILHVREENTPAKRLYLSLDFQLFERQFHFIGETQRIDQDELPRGYRLRRVGTFNRRTFEVSDACREEKSAEIYGRSYYPPLYLRLLFVLFRPQMIERYAILGDDEWAGVYAFKFTSKKEAARSSIHLYRKHRGRGVEEALLTRALARAEALDAPKLAIVAHEGNRELLTACEELGFTKSFTMEGMVRKLSG